MKIAYVLEDAGLSGGARVVLEHCTRLAKRGHDVTLFTVTGNDPRTWFDTTGINHVATGTYNALQKALTRFHGCKVATWWRTANVVAKSGGRNFYLVQDIETSYYPDKKNHKEVLATYELPLTIITEGVWVTEQLPGARNIGIGIDHDTYKQTFVRREPNTLLYSYRGHHLKGPELFESAAKRLPRQVGITTFGLDRPPIPTAKHLGFVSDAGVADLYNRSAVYVSSSRHEGFNLPVLEAMACGCPVVTTLADGNAEFCIDGFNCLVVGRDPDELADAVCRVLSDPGLAGRLAREGIATAANYQWDNVIKNLERVLKGG